MQHLVAAVAHFQFSFLRSGGQGDLNVTCPTANVSCLLVRTPVRSLQVLILYVPLCAAIKCDGHGSVQSTPIAPDTNVCYHCQLLSVGVHYTLYRPTLRVALCVRGVMKKKR